MEEAAPDKRHPLYWAGFVVQGDAGPLKQRETPVWGWIGTLIGVAVLGWIFLRKGGHEKILQDIFQL